jgi:hypothetical protein
MLSATCWQKALLVNGSCIFPYLRPSLNKCFSHPPLSHYLSLPLSLSLSFFLSFLLSLSLSLFLSYSLSLFLSFFLSYLLSLSLHHSSISLSLSLTHTHTHTHTFSNLIIPAWIFVLLWITSVGNWSKLLIERKAQKEKDRKRNRQRERDKETKRQRNK